MRNNLLISARWRASEVQRDLDLMGVLWRKLRQNNQRLNRPLFALSQKVASIYHVTPRGDVGDGDLLSLAARKPVLNAVIGLRPESLWHFLAFLKLLDPYTLFLCVADLSGNVVIMLSNLFGSIDTLFSHAGKSLRTEFRAQTLLELRAD